MSDDDKLYKQFIKSVQRQQRAYIKAECARMDKAEKLLWAYQDAMKRLGLHPHSQEEIHARRRQLADMLMHVAETHGDSPTMRFAFNQTLEGKR